MLGAVVNDWTLTGVLTLQSGVPIAVTQATNNNAFAGFGTQRPNLIGDPTLPADERTVEPLVRHLGVFDRAAVHARQRARATRSAGRATATSTWR